MKLIDSLLTEAAGIAAIRRDIHAHPELCFEEVRTADVVAARLTEWGIPMHRGMGTTGIVGIVHGRDGGASGRAVGLRADMDALPMQEFNTFAHPSLLATLLRSGIGVEVMDNRAAARTYNLLAAEGRRAVAAFLLSAADSA